MDLEKFKQNKKLKKSFYAIGIVILLLITTILLYRSYALYQNNHEYNVIKGVIPDFGYDVKFAVVVDNNKSDEIPDRKATNGSYYSVKADCGENTKAEWDYNAWNLKVDNIKSNSKCSLTFTSNLSKEEYDKYIEAGIEYRRNTYRGKNITDLKTSGALYTQISNCTFDDIYVGDYITGSQGVTWLIADINNYLHTGDTELTRCHATIIPAGYLETGRMNASDTTEGGYAGSEMVTSTLNNILSKYVTPDFGTHIIEYRNLLTDEVDKTRINSFGTTASGAYIGASSYWKWVSRKIDLMSEVNVYGTTIWSSSGFDIGLDTKQYAIFKIKPEFINADENGNRYWYWLKSISTSSYYVYVDLYGGAAGYGAQSTRTDIGIRPRFLIG